jgi:hypothetical protein
MDLRAALSASSDGTLYIKPKRAAKPDMRRFGSRPGRNRSRTQPMITLLGQSATHYGNTRLPGGIGGAAGCTAPAGCMLESLLSRPRRLAEPMTLLL